MRIERYSRMCRAGFSNENPNMPSITIWCDSPIPSVNRPPVAALAPRMLALAGEVADGTITWMTGPATIGDHIAPSITKSAEGAGRPAPRVIGALPVMVTDDPDAARARASEVFSVYNDLPSYRAMLDREGAAGPADVAVVGDESTVRAGVSAMADAGCTDFLAVEFASSEQERTQTRDLLRALL